jgi:hypothetical protein
MSTITKTIEERRAARQKTIRARFADTKFNAPSEWDLGKIVLPQPPAKPMKGRALGQRGPKSSIETPGYGGAVTLTDGAAEALGAYRGTLTIGDGVVMSKEAAAHLVKRRSMGLYRSKLNPAIRKVFESTGSWTDWTWTRKS